MTAILPMSADEYHADPCDRPSLSASIACVLVTSSPAHARAAHPKLNPNLVREEESKFDIGTAAHSAFLQGIDKVRIVYANDWRTKEAKELRDAARADGMIPLLEKHAHGVTEMVQAVREQIGKVDIQPTLFTDGLPEQTIVWEDDHGVMCRARLDWLQNDLSAITDLKTTSKSANPESWSRTLFSIGADVQVAMYLRGLSKITGRDYDGDAFRYVVVETQPPYAMSVVSLAPDALALARKKVDYAIEKWAQCLLNDSWPAYPMRVAFAEAPPWEESRWLEREVREVAA